MKKEILDYKKQTMKEVFESFPKQTKNEINDFLKYCSISASDNSIKKISNKIILIADTFEKPLNQLTLENLREFLILLNKNAKATATKNDIKKTLKRFLKWKYKDWSSKFNGLEDVRLNTKNEQRELSKSDLLTPDEMQIIISSVDSLKYKTILLLMQETANRPEELIKATWSQVDFNLKEIKLKSSKTGESRSIPINESIPHLNRYRTECFYHTPRNADFIFPSPNNQKTHMTTQALSEFLLKLERRLKFKKHLYPYLWRHSILSRMIKTLSPKVYEMYAGHSLEMGMKTYAHLDTDDLKKELFDKVFNIEELTESENKKLKQLEETTQQQGELLNYLMTTLNELTSNGIELKNGKFKSLNNALPTIKTP